MVDLHFHVEFLLLDMMFTRCMDLNFNGFERLFTVSGFHRAEIELFRGRFNAENLAIIHEMQVFGVNVFVIKLHLFFHLVETVAQR